MREEITTWDYLPVFIEKAIEEMDLISKDGFGNKEPVTCVIRAFWLRASIKDHANKTRTKWRGASTCTSTWVWVCTPMQDPGETSADRGSCGEAELLPSTYQKWSFLGLKGKHHRMCL